MFSDVGAWLDLICHVSQCSLQCLQGLGCVLFHFESIHKIRAWEGERERNGLHILSAYYVTGVLLRTLHIFYFIFKITS